MVQRAEIPPLRQFNPKVPVELERVLAKSLAQDPAKRYQTAREFGQDLNNMLFHMGRAVSSFDLSQLVLPIWRERQKKKKDKVDKGAIIGSLIDEALFEFSSLEGDRSSKSTIGTVPVSIGSFEDVHNWGDEMSVEPPAVGQDHGPMSYELGNLAALEDDEPDVSPRTPSGAQPAPRMPTPPGSHPAAVLPSGASASAADEVIAQKGQRGGVLGWIFLGLLIAAGAGAYFGGVIPH